MDKYKKKKDSYNLVFAILWGLLFVYWFTTAIYNVSMKSYITTLNKAIEYTDMIKPKELEFKKIKNPNEFNENFVIDEKDNMFSFDADTLVSTAIKFYDTTGCQLYYVNVDLEKAGKEIKNDKDAEERRRYGVFQRGRPVWRVYPRQRRRGHDRRCQCGDALCGQAGGHDLCLLCGP